MTIQCETRGTAGLCLLHTLLTGCASIMPLFAWNIVLVVPSGHRAQTCWKLLLIGQSTAPARWGVRGVPRHRLERKQNSTARKVWGSAQGMEGWHMEQAWSTEGVMHVHLCGSAEGTFLAPGKVLQPHCCQHRLSALRWQLRAPTLLGLRIQGKVSRWQSASRDSPRSTHLPSSLVALPAHLGVTTCSPNCITGTLLLSVTRAAHLSCGKAKHSSAGEFSVLNSLEEPWNGMEAPRRGGRQMSILNNLHKEMPLALIAYL